MMASTCPILMPLNCAKGFAAENEGNDKLGMEMKQPQLTSVTENTHSVNVIHLNERQQPPNETIAIFRLKGNVSCLGHVGHEM